MIVSPILQNNAYDSVFKNCSPKIINFITKLGSLKVDDSLKVSDGTVFRIPDNCVLRSYDEQHELFCKGRTVSKKTRFDRLGNYQYYDYDSKVVDKNQIVTNAKAGASYHNFGLAIDVIFRKFGYGETLSKSDLNGLSTTDFLKQKFIESGIVKLAKECGLSWGGDWTDFVDIYHFQDDSYSLPALNEVWSNNCNFDFVTKNKVTRSNWLYYIIAIILGIVGVKLWK